MKVSIDLGRCEGHARCLECAPEIFGYDDVTNQAFVVADADLQTNSTAIRDAAEGCPELAIKLTEDAIQPSP
jgi:ferredoxin